MFIFAKEILNGQFIFVQVNRQKTTVKKKITFFLKNYVASLFTIFEKVFAICKFFYRSMFRCNVLRPFVFYLFEVQFTVLASPYYCRFSSYF